MGSNYVSIMSTTFLSCPIVSSVSGVYASIYVPASMLDTYKTSTYWSDIADRLVGV